MIGERGGWNLYGMVSNDTVTSVDILGLLRNSDINVCVKNKKGGWCCGKSSCPDKATYCCENNRITGFPKIKNNYRCCPKQIEEEKIKYKNCLEEVEKTYKIFYEDWRKTRDEMLKELGKWETLCKKDCQRDYKNDVAKLTLCEYLCSSMATATSGNIHTGHLALVAEAQVAELAEYARCADKYFCGAMFLENQ